MNDTKIELALEIIKLKIVHCIKDYKGNDKEEFEQQLKELIQKKEKVYELDEETINELIHLQEINKEN